MRFDVSFLLATLVTSAAASAIADPRHIERAEVEDPARREFWKRRGGGGGGGGRGGGGGSSGGSSRGGSSGSGSSGSSGRTGSSGSSGGRSGVRPTYAGNRYAGGATSAVPAGRKTASGLAPYALIGGAALAFWPGIWLGSAYLYGYHHPYTYHNDTSNKDETHNVTCACAQNADCGCDDSGNYTYLNELIGNGSYQGLNKSVINVANVNGSKMILLNGTLPDGTADADDAGSPATSLRYAAEALGFWPVVAIVLATVCAV